MIHQGLHPGGGGAERRIIGGIFKHLEDGELFQVFLVLLLLYTQLLSEAVLDRIVVKGAANKIESKPKK